MLCDELHLKLIIAQQIFAYINSLEEYKPYAGFGLSQILNNACRSRLFAIRFPYVHNQRWINTIQEYI